MKSIFALLFTWLSVVAASQTLSPEGIFCATGNHQITGYGQISWTLGDNQVRTYKNSSAILTQGFLQTRITLTGVEDFAESNGIILNLFPNPVEDILTITIEGNKYKQLIFNLYSMDGKKILTRTADYLVNQTEIDFTGLQSGFYFLKVSDSGNAYFRSYKLIYNK